MEHKNGIVLAMFGTTVEPALQGLFNIRTLMEQAYPQTRIRIAFTSNIIRKIWQKRAADPGYVEKHQEIPQEILHVQGPLATIANFQDSGYDSLVVQPTHIAPAEEFQDLTAYVEALASIETLKEKYKPFQHLVIGRPLLGTFGTRYPYADDIRAAARAMQEDARQAKKAGAALVYMGHGNNYFPSGGLYLQFEHEMQTLYPDVLTVVGTMEGYPDFFRVLSVLQHAAVQKVIMRPFLIVAGDHVTGIMAGLKPDSWKSMLEKEGIAVTPFLQGMGENDQLAQIFVDHAADAAGDAGIVLK